MSVMLGGLKFVAAKRPLQMPAVLVRRNKLSNQIYEQIKLATALRDGSTYAPIKLRSFRNRDTGDVKRLEVPKRVRPWWFTSDSGKVCLQIRYGAKLLDISGKGRTAIEVKNADDLIKTLELLKSAVEAGELDAQLEAAGLRLKTGFKK